MSADPIQIQKELLKMPEWKRLDEIRQFQQSLYIFQSNAEDLISLLKSVQSGPAAVNLWMLQNRLELDKFRREVARLLHNFVASSFSLIDHSRRFYEKQYKKEERFKNYEEELKKQFAEEPLCQFVQGLRNYFIHKKVPIIISSLSVNQGKKAKNSTFLEKTELLDYKWKPLAKKYLDSISENIDLFCVVNEYTEKVMNFYNWMFSRLEVIHSSDLKAVENKQQELRKAIGMLVPSHLETALKVLEQIRTEPEQVFLEFLDPQRWKAICDSKSDPIERANAILDAVEEFSPSLGSLRQQTVEAFKKYYGIQ